MKYAGLNRNDLTAGKGVCVTFYTQGCPHHCVGCHNPETWDFEGGLEFNQDVLNDIFTALTANGVYRDFCVMGGEPMCPQNAFLTRSVIEAVKKQFPERRIYVWTGYLYEQLQVSLNPHIQAILKEIDVLVDGPFIKELRDVTLPMRGSSNQRILNLTKK